MISEEKQLLLARIIVDRPWEDDLVDYTDDDDALRVARRAIAEFMQTEDSLDADVRAKIGSLKKSLVESTPEWDIMYRKYYEEELRRRGQG